ncbi:outer membrane beta-barrel domain-containing protein [Aliiglaciecola sp. CAU 1673]|uniref:outer membrane beta-barrel domain-containing protein n=1 Tax=Aliiglaciecola sp. CAU 1673 TaxID=3032595 RepID=UPI0023DA7FBF|nr:outer membrane beta-barrel domain-containing protein [Aliiglaciecola sp. CAU 1673]MDF2177862.1 outer membrane beta-barrel domain-containing protein [Aliiglaciecola sp. CAU 1673]
METRIFSVFLILLGCLLPAFAQQVPPLVVEPEVDRRQINDADIDTEDFEVGLFYGQISIEDFSNSSVTGLTLAYHITENIFMEASYGQADAGLTSFEQLSGGAPFLTDDEREYRYYDLGIGYNFNGEVFVKEGWALNSDFYLMVGGGSTDFGGDNHFTLSLGGGYRLFLTDYLALRLDVRDHIFSSEIIGEKKDTHNIHYSLGASWFF